MNSDRSAPGGSSETRIQIPTKQLCKEVPWERDREQRKEWREEIDTKRVKSRCPERRAGVERGAWGKIPEKKKLQGGEMEQVIEKERRGGRETWRKVSERQTEEKRTHIDMESLRKGRGEETPGRRG